MTIQLLEIPDNMVGPLKLAYKIKEDFPELYRGYGENSKRTLIDGAQVYDGYRECAKKIKKFSPFYEKYSDDYLEHAVSCAMIGRPEYGLEGLLTEQEFEKIKVDSKVVTEAQHLAHLRMHADKEFIEKRCNAATIAKGLKPWDSELERVYAREVLYDMIEKKNVSYQVAADKVNEMFHGGKPVRTRSSIDYIFQKYKPENYVAQQKMDWNQNVEFTKDGKKIEMPLIETLYLHSKRESYLKKPKSGWYKPKELKPNLDKLIALAQKKLPNEDLLFDDKAKSRLSVALNKYKKNLAK